MLVNLSILERCVFPLWSILPRRSSEPDEKRSHEYLKLGLKFVIRRIVSFRVGNRKELQIKPLSLIAYLRLEVSPRDSLST